MNAALLEFLGSHGHQSRQETKAEKAERKAKAAALRQAIKEIRPAISAGLYRDPVETIKHLESMAEFYDQPLPGCL